MRQLAFRFSALLLLAALALPSVGPLVDHHFAERQPGHRHVAGVVQPHTHSYEDEYHHHNTGGNGDVPVLVNYDSGLAASTVVTTADVPLDSPPLFEPTSIFSMPLAPETRARLRHIPPPHEPPRGLV
ncbi:MAG: hypothetical protein L0177_05945 [Chloroflexi bacterium]|nr:hypothetical protein [Chloroflexota bacterium]